MFCAIYDVFASQHPLAFISRTEFTPEQSGSQLNYYLMVAEYRYTLYLKLLVSVQDRPKQTWPLPPWYIPLRIGTRLEAYGKANFFRGVALMLHAHLLSPIHFAEDKI